MVNMADQYLQGAGREVDVQKAVTLYQEAASLGHYAAQNHLSMLISESDPSTAFRWLHSAAASGAAVAQKSLAFAYANGQGIDQNLEEAARWMQRAAEQDDLEAAYVLSSMYQQGQGVPVDVSSSLSWLHRSAEAGYGTAQHDYAIRLAAGPNVASYEF
eukprot:symbB.v1.2.041643.t1/scaffold8442.1/size6307/1